MHTFFHVISLFLCPFVAAQAVGEEANMPSESRIVVPFFDPQLPNHEAPVIVKRVQAEYPEAASRIHLQGFVLLRATVMPDGSVAKDIEIVSGLGKGKYGCEEAAITAVRQYECQPGRIDGVAVPVQMMVKVDFTIEPSSEVGHKP